MKTEAPNSKNTTRKLPKTKQKLAIEYRPIAALRLDPKNPRLHSEKQVQQIAKSIEAFGFNVPVLINTDMQVVAGHGRLQARKLVDITEVPTIRLEHMTASQARAFLIADNRLTENAEWDNQLLAQQLRDLSEVELDFNLEVTGFEMAEIDTMIERVLSESAGNSSRK